MDKGPEYFDAIITGAGPAGLFCAVNCCNDKPYRILVPEKKHAAGRKLLLSGSGSCNITHSGSIKDFETRYGKNGRFLRHALAGFSNTDMVSFLSGNGIITIETDDGKIFPESMRAKDILDLLISLCNKSAIRIEYNSPVLDIEHTGRRFRVRAENLFFESDFCVIASGGASYPGTGSSGDGYRLAESLGHIIIPPKPALTPVTALTADTAFPPELSGLTIKNSIISIFRGSKLIESRSGDLLFTHTGLSGPAILDLSRNISPGDRILLSFTSHNREYIEEQFIILSRKEGRRSIKNLLHSFDIPERLVLLILEKTGIPRDKKSSEINRDERKRLMEYISAYPVTVAETGGFSIAMATAGGVSTSEINPRTMESKLVPGLFFAGEVMDIDGDTGGYNLQAAFSTGKLAAETIRKRIEQRGRSPK